ncbi:MAG: ParB/RepB/Spo0J family partition protein [Lachnospiraceae bacterium]|nr:ParB/RepB/Spo0J family partition protein [Lachnospiraceae bacterium]
MAAAKRGLGRGLDALIPKSAAPEKNETKAAPATQQTPKGEIPSTEGTVVKVKITKVEPNRDQPRKNFDEDALQELADSIKQYGIFQPILVQDRKDHYEIIAGERRWRAAKLAGLKEVPVIIKQYTEQEIVEISLIENIQRENLNPIEEAQAYKRLLTEFNLKQDEFAERVSKSRTAVTNSMRLLKLCDEVQRMIIEEMITTGHARALITVENPSDQYELAQKIFDEKLSVRETEKLVRDLGKEKKTKAVAPKQEDTTLKLIYQDIENRMKSSLGTKVSIDGKGDGTGKIEIEFYSNDELDRLTELLTHTN